MESLNNSKLPTSRSDCTLVVMAKAPRPGVVKTRLAQHLPESAVLALYQCLLRDTIALAQSLCDVEVAIMCPSSDVDELVRLAGTDARVVPQTGVGLVAGLTSVFTHFAASGDRKVIAFNSDSPHLPASVLELAFDSLTSDDLVVGPTHDGGYYLVGAKISHLGLFEGDGMGTSNALERLMESARTLRLSVRVLDPFYDVDIPADLTRLDDELRLFPERAPRTASWLVDWKQTMQRKLAAGES